MKSHQFHVLSGAPGIVCIGALLTLSACDSGVTAIPTTGPSAPPIVSATIVQPAGAADHAFTAKSGTEAAR